MPHAVDLEAKPTCQKIFDAMIEYGRRTGPDVKINHIALGPDTYMEFAHEVKDKQVQSNCVLTFLGYPVLEVNDKGILKIV